MTRDEAETHVRSVQRVCRGRRTATADAALVALLADAPPTAEQVLQWSIDFKLDLAWVCLLIDDDQKLDVALPLKLRTKSITAGEVLALFEDATQARIRAELVADLPAVARQIDAAGRRSCGTDVNDLILSQPLDGEEHAAECPGCGQLITWTAPALEIESE